VESVGVQLGTFMIPVLVIIFAIVVFMLFAAAAFRRR